MCLYVVSRPMSNTVPCRTSTVCPTAVCLLPHLLLLLRFRFRLWLRFWLRCGRRHRRCCGPLLRVHLVVLLLAADLVGCAPLGDGGRDLLGPVGGQPVDPRVRQAPLQLLLVQLHLRVQLEEVLNLDLQKKNRLRPPE